MQPVLWAREVPSQQVPREVLLPLLRALNRLSALKMNPQKPRNSKSTLRNIAILSGIGFEMGAIIFLAAKGGIWLDQYYQTDKRLFTAIATMVGVAIAIYVVLLQLKRVKQ